MFAKSAAFLLSVAAMVNPTNAVEMAKPDCDCEAYLKSEYWDYLKKNGITMSEFCCQVGFVNKCVYGGGIHPLGEGTPTFAQPGQYSPDHIPSYVTQCVAQSGLDKLGKKFPEKHYIDASAKAPNYGEDQSLTGGYYYKPCYWARDYYGFIACAFAYYLDEAVQACYCYYRNKIHCTCEDCTDDDEGAKDLLIDRYVAHYDPEVVCNQCIQEVKDPHGSGHDTPYGGHQQDGYGYGSYSGIHGVPYDVCQGYCYLIDPYSYYYSKPPVYGAP